MIEIRVREAHIELEIQISIFLNNRPNFRSGRCRPLVGSVTDRELGFPIHEYSCQIEIVILIALRVPNLNHITFTFIDLCNSILDFTGAALSVTVLFQRPLSA